MKKALSFLLAFVLIVSLPGVPLLAGAAAAAPAADILNVDFTNGTPEDRTGKHTPQTQGQPIIKAEQSLSGKTAATFDGASSYFYDMADADYTATESSVTMECLFRYQYIPESGESDVFSNQQRGGMGIGIDAGRLNLFVNVGGAWKQPACNIETGRWYHVAGTYDGRTVKLYVNGELADSVAAPGIIQPPETAARFFVIGGDSGSQVVQYHSQTTVSFARLYSQALTAEDAALLSEEALKAVSPVDSGDMLLNVDFADGTAADTAGGRPPRAQGEPVIASLDELKGQKAAAFDGSSSYSYDMTAADYTAMETTVTLESMFRYDELPSSGEFDIFSNQQYGGIGIGTLDGRLTLFANVNGTWIQPDCEIGAGIWYHVVGTYDGKTARLYINGRLADSIEAAGSLQPPAAAARFFVIGGDSGNQTVQFQSRSTVNFARLYKTVLGDDEIAGLSNRAFAQTDVPEDPPQQVKVGIVAAGAMASDAMVNVNLHIGSDIGGSIDQVAFDVRYDPERLEYKGLQHLRTGASVKQSSPGILSVACRGKLSASSFQQYGDTRLAKLDFAVRHVDQEVQTSLEIENIRLYARGEPLDNGSTAQGADHGVTLLPQDRLDLNGDGFIGAGDVALADSGLREAAAQAASIHPYKHVLVLTMDGAGLVWNPDEMYYASSAGVNPVKTSDPAIMALRKNTYAMELINQQFAVSYTASAVNPPISAQNYSSILHGVPWQQFPSAYRVTNDIAARQYFADFGKERALFPSVFSSLSNQLPGRPLAAFAEWTPILNGIIEPDIPVFGSVSSGGRAFYDVADYIRGDSFQDTPLIFMESDKMDSLGHTVGYYTPSYWSGLQSYDSYFKAVMDALEETGHADDTLIITNADHGGSGTGHSNPGLSSHMNVFIALGGLTIDSGRRLSGGTNADIPALILNGLRMEKPAEMAASSVFDSSAFLSQEELSQKNRDVENVVFRRSGNRASLTLDNPKTDTRAVDMVIDLHGSTVESILTDGTLLRQSEEQGRLLLTIVYDSQPENLAVVTFASAADKVELSEVMLGAADGSETYCNLSTETSCPDALRQAIEDAREAIASGLYPDGENQQLLQQEIDASRKLIEQAASDSAYQTQLSALRLALARLKGLDTDTLSGRITAAEQLHMEDYLDGDAKDRFLSALEEAKNVLKSVEKEDVTQQRIDQTAAALETAQRELVARPDKSALQELLEKARQIDLTAYIEKSGAELAAAIGEAAALYADPQADARQVAQAEARLSEAIASLIPIGSVAESTKGTPSVTGPDAIPATGDSGGAAMVLLAVGALLTLAARKRTSTKAN